MNIFIRKLAQLVQKRIPQRLRSLTKKVYINLSENRAAGSLGWGSTAEVSCQSLEWVISRFNNSEA